MKKKTVITIIIVATLLIGSLTISAYAWNQANTEKENRIIYLNDYWTASKSSIADINLNSIYAGAKTLVEGSETIVFDDTLITDYFVKWRYADKKTVLYDKDLLMVAPSKSDNKKEVYFTFIASLTQCFPDYVYYGDYDYLQHNYNRPMGSSFWFSTDYKEAGFDTMEEYFNAFRAGECGLTKETYSISFIDYSIRRLSDDTELYQEITKAK